LSRYLDQATVKGTGSLKLSLFDVSVSFVIDFVEQGMQSLHIYAEIYSPVGLLKLLKNQYKKSYVPHSKKLNKFQDHQNIAKTGQFHHIRFSNILFPAYIVTQNPKLKNINSHF